MPVRLLSSPVLVWPDRKTVDAAARRWAQDAGTAHPEAIRIGYFGSYARGNWGVGSDLDLVAVVDPTEEPWIGRGIRWDLAPLPVPADLLVYTEAELEKMAGEPLRRMLDRETVWIYERGKGV